MSAGEHQRAPTPGALPRTGSDGYRSDSRQQRPPDSDGYQSGSEEPPSSAEVPGSGSDSAEPVDPDERIDPFEAFAQVATRERERKKREREPGIWLPGGDELEQETGRLADQETRFSRDAWGGRGNPQVSVRLRPSDFERLRNAADLYGVRPTTLARMMVIRGVGAILDTELRRKGEFLRGGPP